MAKRTKHGWAIAGRYGLYVGWHMSRREMIAQHVHDLQMPHEPEVSRFALNGRLSEVQTQAWDRCKKSGDRAVKVTITYEAV